TAIAVFAAATLASACPHRMFGTEMYYGTFEPCDRPQGQCCPGLVCDLDRYECQASLRAHKKTFFKSNDMCYGPGYPCGSWSECCSEGCYVGTCL
ncbi:hypothetical protein BG015_009837, partial [Linnemannia schmuckeri]